jgi:hypothetical protein
MRRTLLLVLLLSLAISASADDKINFKVRVQPRLDFGDFADSAGDEYETQQDFYIRRNRLEVVGRPLPDVLYILAVSGDRSGQRGASSDAKMAYAFVDYKLATTARLRAGLVKLPYARGALVSSSRLLLIERTQTANAAASAFGSYITPHLTLHGKLRDGSVGYSVALTDGLQPGDTDRLSPQSVSASDPGFVSRFTFSPKGWIEKRGSESHLGEGRHLTLGFNAVTQNGIEFGATSEDRLLWGGDFSLHRGGFTLQAEYLCVDRDGVAELSPAGWYVQSGLYLADLQLEPAIRFERYDADLADGKDVTSNYTGGLNWYKHGHDLKFMVNVVHTRFQRGVRQVDGAVSRTMLQLQNQMYF